VELEQLPAAVCFAVVKALLVFALVVVAVPAVKDGVALSLPVAGVPPLPATTTVMPLFT